MKHFICLKELWSRGKWCSGDPLHSLCLRSSHLEEIVGLGIPLRPLWPTLRCRRVAGVSPLLSIGWWYLSSVSPKRHCCRVSAADKGRWVYPLDPRPDTVVLYSGCTSGKRRAWYLPDDRHTASLVGLRGGWRHSRMKTISLFMDPEILCLGKGLVLPNINKDTIATNSRFLILSLPNHEMSRKSPFAIQKALKGIGGDPKSVKKLRSGDLLIETVSALQTKSFLSAKVFLDCPLIVTPHRSLNSCRGVISEPDLLCASEAEILEGLSDQGVTQAYSADSKLCPKWKAEKQIQEIKTNKNITYIEARKLIAPPLTLTYSTSTQTDENITKIKCPPLELLQSASSNSKQNKTTPTPSTSSSSTQAHLLRSTSTISKSQPPIPKIPISNDLPSTTIPSTSAILPTIQKEALLPIPILTSTTTSSAGNSLITSASSDTHLFPTTSNKFAALSTEIQ
ncbi:uncharacterized protein TNCV_3520141 [Trichonephila clavipes]|nr:uncharacterized protein TNCV_3520141 [Trichonephila clavipes]